MGLRVIKDVDCPKLRLFFLSLLWRAAATNLFEFEPISLPAKEKEQLRDMVLSGKVEPYNFCPISLVQLITKNFPHNLSPTRHVKRRPIIDNETGELAGSFEEVHYFRFFFDGLIAHMHISESGDYVTKMGSYFAGEGNDLWVTTFRSEDSPQLKWLWSEIGKLSTASSR